MTTTTADPNAAAFASIVTLIQADADGETAATATFGDGTGLIPWETYPMYCADRAAANVVYAQNVAAVAWPPVAQQDAAALVTALQARAAAFDFCAHTPGTFGAQTRIAYKTVNASIAVRTAAELLRADVRPRS